MLILDLKAVPFHAVAFSVYLSLWSSLWIHSRTLCFTCPRSMLQVLHRAMVWNNFWIFILFCHSAALLWDIFSSKVEKILKGNLDLIPSPSLLWVGIMGGKVCLRHEGKTLLGIVNKPFVLTRLLTIPSNVLPSHLSRP